MRLTKSETDCLKNTLNGLSSEAKLYLFGSRLDDNKQGGDIDLLVVSSSLKQRDIRKLRLDFFTLFGEQKIDIVLDNGEFNNPFNQLIYKQAKLL